ncbi:MAG: FCD domain-containing protein, partial [Anaerolineae bacterium]|jgi:DNA-binding GntR family transcriptional regulator
VGYDGDDDDWYARYTFENRQFHCLIAAASGNRELATMVSRVYDRLARFMVMHRTGESMQHSHRRIIGALQARDPEAARQAVLDELTDTRRVVLDRVIQEQGEAWHLGRYV